MKKIITLLFFVGGVATSFAQYDHRANDGRDDQYANSSRDRRNSNWDDRDGGQYNHGSNYDVRARDFQIEKINRDFDYKIQSIQNDRFMRRREKKAAIRNAQNERSRQLQMINDGFRYHHGRNH